MMEVMGSKGLLRISRILMFHGYFNASLELFVKDIIIWNKIVDVLCDVFFG
jgi:hypothetical protein